MQPHGTAQGRQELRESEMKLAFQHSSEKYRENTNLFWKIDVHQIFCHGIEICADDTPICQAPPQSLTDFAILIPFIKRSPVSRVQFTRG